MAKKTGSQRRQGGRSELAATQSLRGEGGRNMGGSMNETREYKDILKEFISSPAVKYVAGGIATAFLARVANNISDKYPELSHFIRENLDNIEGRLGEYRDGMGETTRH